MMQQDALWQAFSELRPCLKDGLERRPQQFRGEDWVLLRDPAGGEFLRCPRRVMDFLQRFNGRVSIAEVLQGMPEDQQPAREEVLRLFTLLDEKHLLQHPLARDAHAVMQNQRETRSRQRRQRWLLPLAIKWALWDPDRFLTQTRPLWHALMRPVVGMFCVVLMCVAGLLAVELTDALAAHGQSRFLDTGNLLWLWLLYPLLKLVHELGHAVAIKHWGGEVHELGVMFLVFLPVPYVEASASYAFEHKSQRMLVAAAGILVELVVASLALLIWWQSADVLIRDLAFNIMVLAGVSTLLINGNPLLKFDGYHVLSEYLELPNLAARSQQLLRAWWGNRLLGQPVYPVREQGKERRTIALYGFASACYRILIALGIIWWIAGKAFVLGVALALWYLLLQWCWPAVKGLRELWTRATSLALRTGLLLRMAALMALLLWVLCWPWHRAMVFEAVLSVPENAQIRAESPGFVVAQHVAHGEPVSAGQVVVSLRNAQLEAQMATVSARLAENQQRLQATPLHEEVQRQILRSDATAIEAELADLQAQLFHLELGSPLAGTFEHVATQSLEGRFVQQGEVLATVFSPQGVTLSAVVEQGAMTRLQHPDVHYEVMLPASPGRVYQAQLVQEYPAFSRQLPGALLGSGGGGAVRIDARDERGLTAVEAVYQLRFAVPDYPLDYLAARAYVKAIHPPQSILSLISDGLQRLWWQHQQRIHQ